MCITGGTRQRVHGFARLKKGEECEGVKLCCEESQCTHTCQRGEGRIAFLPSPALRGQELLQCKNVHEKPERKTVGNLCTRKVIIETKIKTYKKKEYEEVKKGSRHIHQGVCRNEPGKSAGSN